MNRLVSLVSRARVRWLATPAALLLASTAASAQEVVDRWGPTPPASTYGPRFDSLFSLITTLIGISFLIVLVMLLVPCLRDNAKKGKKAHFDHGTSLHDKRFTAVVSVVVFIVLDAWVLVRAMGDLREAYWNVPAPDTPGIFKVEVLAQQWAWNFRTPGVDGELGTPDDVITINELTVPIGRPVVFNLTSKDVIHSLFLPDMRLKRDANPGAINVAWFEAAKSGDFDILCAELCGYAHYQMHGKLHVLPEADFPAWEKDASALALAAYDANDTEARWAWDWKE
ncbi:MAG: hypothetical protein H6825_02595 [Planctomycetes bacterium]|nr:hypothetical protein [Planctomycetota bacterium]